MIEPGHHRGLATIVGAVTVNRLAYRATEAENLYLQDAALNLPAERHSHGLRALAATWATRGSYEEAQAAITRSTGVDLGKRQVEDLARRAAIDVEEFYDDKRREPGTKADVLVISADGKGIVMRPDALRPATMAAARADKHKLKTRLSKGEQRNSKRMAELAVVYDATPVPRTPGDVFARADDGKKAPAPVAKGKWLTASVVDSAKEVIAGAFDEAGRRDPGHARPWVCLVDGAKHQIDVIRAEARRRGVEVSVVCDFIHVLDIPCPHCAPIVPRWSLGPAGAKNPCHRWTSASDAPSRRRRRWYLDRVTPWLGRHRLAHGLGVNSHRARCSSGCGASVSRRSARPQRFQAAALVTPSRSASSAREQPQARIAATDSPRRACASATRPLQTCRALVGSLASRLRALARSSMALPRASAVLAPAAGVR